MDFRSLDLGGLAQTGQLTTAEVHLATVIAARQAYHARVYTEDPANHAWVQQIFATTDFMNSQERHAHLKALRTRGALDDHQLKIAHDAVIDDSRDPLTVIAHTLTAIPPTDPVQRLDWAYLLELNQTYMRPRWWMRQMMGLRKRPPTDPSPPERSWIVLQCILSVLFMITLANALFSLILTTLYAIMGTSLNPALGALLLITLSIPSIAMLLSAYRERGLLDSYKRFHQTYQAKRAELIKQHPGHDA